MLLRTEFMTSGNQKPITREAVKRELSVRVHTKPTGMCSHSITC